MRYYKIGVIFIVIVFSSSLAGCAETTILPEGQGHYRAVANGITQSQALNRAKSKAFKQCEFESKKLIVESYQTSLNNSTQTAKQNASISQATLSMLNPENYCVQLNFRCV